MGGELPQQRVSLHFPTTRANPGRGVVLAVVAVVALLAAAVIVNSWLVGPAQARDPAWADRAGSVESKLEDTFEHDFKIERGRRAGGQWHESVFVDGTIADCQVRTDDPVLLICTGINLVRS